MDYEALKYIEGEDGEYSPRYSVEHKMLPYWFYNCGPRFLGQLLSERGTYMCSLYDHYLDGMSNPFTPSDFTFVPRIFCEGASTIMILQIIMPQPTRALLCRAIYLCTEVPTGKRLYITSEYDDNGKFELCAWTETRFHFNFFTVRPEDELEQVLEVFEDKDQIDEIIRAFQEMKENGDDIEPYRPSA